MGEFLDGFIGTVAPVVDEDISVVENGGVRIFYLLRNISQKKVEENKKYIKEHKKKDKLRQNIMEIRGKLRDMSTG